MDTTNLKVTIVFTCNLIIIFLQVNGIVQALNISDGSGETFDFIVVGAGTSGCVVAARLAESGKHKVLLIEAGGTPLPEFDIPALVQTTRTESVQSYATVAQRFAGLSENGILTHKVGKMLGGGSAFNGMFLTRGSSHDFDNWAKLTEDDSWSYKSMLKYFKKYEKYLGDHPSNQRGTVGPIPVSSQDYAPLLNEWLQGGRELGFDVVESNGPQAIGFGPMEFARSHGRRVSSYKGYIQPKSSHSQQSTGPAPLSRFNNLQIIIHTEVSRIIFEGDRAVGVKFNSNSTNHSYAKASKEIVITAGVMDTPAVLMRSGIGPKEILDEAHVRIPPIKYLPVGNNLMDHVTVPVVVIIGNKSGVFIPERDLNPVTWKMFNELGDGPYSSRLGVSGQAFLLSSTVSTREHDLGWSDIQLLPKNMGIQNPLSKSVKTSRLNDSEVTIHWSVYLGRPKSKGTVKLDPTNIENKPVIDFQFFGHEDDLRSMIDGIKICLKLCEKTTSFQKLGCRIPTDSLPACSHLTFRSDLYWECYVNQLANTGLHGAGTCRMGKIFGDSLAVVDSKLRVLGVRGLIVSDASVMPEITNANPMGAIYAIAEKAADMILERHTGV